MESILLKTLRKPRHLMQVFFLCLCLAIGVQFALFVGHFESGGLTPAYIRPVGVEAFLPIGALASLKYWAMTGIIEPVHPAALVLLLTILGVSFVARKSFCSWICPVGTLSEFCGSIGHKLFGRHYRVWPWLDVLLRFFKYALLVFFLKLILIDMPLRAIGGLLSSEYWAISDIKMLHFFTGMTLTSASIIILLAALSMVYQNFWCRYLCPYGALAGLLAWLSPLKIRREEKACSGCGACSRHCASRLPVQTSTVICSPECTSCLTCLDSCPEHDALKMSLPGGEIALKAHVFGLLILCLMLIGIGTGMLSGNWQTNLTYHDYQRLISK